MTISWNFTKVLLENDHLRGILQWYYRKMTISWNFTKVLQENDHFLEFYNGIIGK